MFQREMSEGTTFLMSKYVHWRDEMEKIDYLGLLVIPLATAILTTVALLIKEWYQNRNNTKRALTEKKLIELYNHLYSVSVRYEGRLQINYRKEIYDIDPNGKELFREIPDTDDPEIWDEAIKEVAGAIYGRIHLLQYDDLIMWLEVENGTQEEFALEDYSVNRFLAFRNFIKQIKKSYGDLYNEFHFSTKKRRNDRINKLKVNLRNVRKNPFLDDEEKEKQIKVIKAKIKKIRRRST